MMNDFSKFFRLCEDLDNLKERILLLLQRNHRMSLSEIKNSLDLPVGSTSGSPNDPVHQAIIALRRENRIVLPGKAWGDPLIELT